jgi:hypothetical protein
MAVVVIFRNINKISRKFILKPQIIRMYLTKLDTSLFIETDYQYLSVFNKISSKVILTRQIITILSLSVVW